MTQPLSCSFDPCQRPAAGSLATRPYCRDHFIITCYAELESSGERLRESSFGDTTVESVRQFVHDCVDQATHLVENSTDLSNLERARLVDILLWAARVGRSLRRSPRKEAALPIRLRSERPGYPWEEETYTRLVSRYGALVECRHPARNGEMLHVSRTDQAEEAAARVAWHRQRGPERQEVGIEFVDCDNFWGLDWASEPVASA